MAVTLILPPTDPARATLVSATETRRGPLATLRLLPRLLGPAMLILCGALLWHNVEPGFGAEVAAALRDIGLSAWLIALAGATASFWALGHYDAIVHKAAGTGVSPVRARRAGRRAIAIGQAAGFGTVTGALVRWRSLPEMGLVDLSKFSVLVSLSFLAAWAVLTAAVAVIVWDGAAGVLLLLGLALLARRLPLPALPGLPHLRRAHLSGLMLWTLIDTMAAALVLWAFLPASVSLPLGLFFLAYLVALGAGMLSQSPGGLGAFELTLIALLPQADPAALVAASLGYRLVYHIGPAVLALIMLVPAPRLPQEPVLKLDPGASPERARDIARHADWGLVRQGAGLLLQPGQRVGWMVRHAPGVVAAVGPALRRPMVSELALFAKAQGKIPMLYKCTAAEAGRARREGWAVMTIAQEAVLDPTEFALEGPCLRQLRRKLRTVEKAGLLVEAEPRCLPWAELTEVNRLWATAHGGERGFSMGRFGADLVAEQAVILGWQGDRLVGFVTFHKTAAGWGLDLMRHRPDAPSGTMQALVAKGIEAAKTAGITRLSLAACPVVPTWPGGLNRLLDDQRKAAAGLYQFKAAFAPRWEPRFAAAPDRARLIGGLACVTWAVHRPASMSRPDFRFEFDAATCEATDIEVLRDIPALEGVPNGMTRPE